MDGINGNPDAPEYPIIDEATFFVPDGGNIIFDGYIDYLKQGAIGMVAAAKRDQKSKFTEVSETVTKYGQAYAYSQYSISVGELVKLQEYQ